MLVAVVVVYFSVRLRPVYRSGQCLEQSQCSLPEPARALDGIGVRGPLTGPLGYMNAALYLQGAVAGCMSTVAVPTRAGRLIGFVASVGLAAATVLTGSRAAAMLLFLPLVASRGDVNR
jgi:hypothetical protein